MKFLSTTILLCFFFLPGVAVADYGDIDINGKLELRDAIVALQLASGINPSVPVDKYATVGGHQRIGIEDVIYILQVMSCIRIPAGQGVPVVKDAIVDKSLLWPPDGRMAAVGVSYNVNGDVYPTVCTLGVTGIDLQGADWEIVDTHHVRLRAALPEGKSDRTYTVAIDCTDCAGLTAHKEVTTKVQFDFCGESSRCVNSSGDGFCDEWKRQGYIDVNANGVYDEGIDVPLPNADPNKPDVYVQYDWMGWAPPGNACDTTADCTNQGSGHNGETCSGSQVIPTKAGSCVYACNADTDCTARMPGNHKLERCISQVCQHTHDPELLAPGALQEVADSFAGHGINLHIIRGHELPHSLVTSFRRNGEMTETCEGGSLSLGNVGVSKYAVSLYDLKATSALDKLNIAYHYTIFSHYSSCDSRDHCSACQNSTNPDGSPKAEKPDTRIPGHATGIAEISGNDFIVSLGGILVDLPITPGPQNVGSTFMHELGHNLGLHHGGGIDTPCETDADCPGGAPGACETTPVGKYCLLSNDENYKPNYLSLMNYRYTLTGILPAPEAGASTPITCVSNADCPAGNRCNLTFQPGHCMRLDFSNEILPTRGNTPSALDETDLSEPAGLGSNRPPDLFIFTDADTCSGGGLMSLASTIGPVDWSGDGDYDDDHVSTAIHYYPGVGMPTCGTDLKLLTGYVDWGPAAPTKFTYKFQCTPYGGPLGDGPAPPFSSRRLTTCMSPEEAIQAHVLYPPRGVKMSLETEGARAHASLPAVPDGQIRVVIHGTKDLDVKEIEQTSLTFHGAKPIVVEMKDVDADGRLDLVMLFKRSDSRLHPEAKRASVKGWLKNSQAFTGTVDLTK